MTLIAYRERLTIEVRGQRLEMVIPGNNQEAQSFKQKYLARPFWEYEAVMTALFERLLGTLDTPQFLDVGAFIGYYSLLAGRLLEGRPGRVVAIESNPSHVAVLREALEVNALTNVEIVHVALSDREEDLHSRHEIVLSEKKEDSTPVQALTGDVLCARLGVKPNIIKIDVHGFEGKTLAGLSETLRGPLRYVMLELHPDYYLEQVAPGISRMQIINDLESLGFRLYYVSGHRAPMAAGRDRFFATGQIPYQVLTAENRGWLMFDRYNAIFILASKQPLEDLLGPSLELPA